MCSQDGSPPGRSTHNLIATIVGAASVLGMGNKYIPSIKDLKAADRFHSKQNPLPKFKKKSAGKLPKKK